MIYKNWFVLGFLSVILFGTTTIAAQLVKAQVCYIDRANGERTDLSEICGGSDDQQAPVVTDTSQELNDPIFLEQRARDAAKTGIQVLTFQEFKEELVNGPQAPTLIIYRDSETGETKKEFGIYGAGAPYNGDILDLTE